MDPESISTTRKAVQEALNETSHSIALKTRLHATSSNCIVTSAGDCPFDRLSLAKDQTT
jgi:hypothetical protein